MQERDQERVGVQIAIDADLMGGALRGGVPVIAQDTLTFLLDRQPDGILPEIGSYPFKGAFREEML